MLNYIWLALIVLGVLVAVGGDWHDLSVNKYHNGEEFLVTIHLPSGGQLEAGRSLSVTAEFAADTLRGAGFVQNAVLVPATSRSGAITLTIDDRTPASWKEIAKASRKEGLAGTVRWTEQGPTGLRASMTLDPVKFARLNAVTNDGVIRYAKTAVELAIGLIGIMALWLGIMKIAEQSGLVAKLASLLKPVTVRLFPDVPPDHPAMGAMIMNISANMLGLSNAATPLGLKAMEELNKLNPKAGTATDAMCTFLVINTTNVQLIPATVIAIRAASGSANPTAILGPVIVATSVALVVGVTTVKLLAKLPLYKRQLQEKG
jgi:spore maturation protein A